MSISNGLRQLARTAPQNAVTVESLTAAGMSGSLVLPGDSEARKLSAVDRCLEILSDSMAKLPNYIFNSKTRERVEDHYLHYVLNIRPNEAMTPFVRKKMLELSRLDGGNSYDWIIRDPRTGRVQELIPIPWPLVTPWQDTAGRMWYTVTHPWTGEPMLLPGSDICHYKCASADGIKGVGVRTRANEVIAAGRAAQRYDLNYYENGGQPVGVLRTESDLGGVVDDPYEKGKKIRKKDLLRREWEKIHAGPKNSHRIAILDYGLDYKPISTSHKDAQFVENKQASVADISRYYGVPLYKLQEGKQAYGSNEQNAIEYVVSTLHPNVTQHEEEQTYKLLTPTECHAGIEIRINMMAELKGDTASRGNWYRTMREVSAFSPNEIRALEDLPEVDGGDERYASKNYEPLSTWAQNRAAEQNGGN